MLPAPAPEGTAPFAPPPPLERRAPASRRGPDPRAACLLALGLALPGLLPLLAWPLPFQDAIGHLGLIGTLHWLALEPGVLDPDVHGQGYLGPNRLFYWVGLSATLTFGPDLGARLVHALALGAVGPGLWIGLRLAGASPIWALAASPLVLGRILACGFVPNVAALAPFAVVLGASLARAPSPALGVGTAVAAAATVATHSFVGLVAAGFLGISGLVDLLLRSWSAAAHRLGAAALVLGLQLGPLAVPGPPAGPREGSALLAIWSALHPPKLDAERLERAWEWVFAWMSDVAWDDRLQAAWLVALVGGAVLGLAQAPTAAARVKALLYLVSSAVVITSVDETIGPPLDWWGSWLRVPTIAGLVLILLAAPLGAASSERRKSGAEPRSLLLFRVLASTRRAASAAALGVAVGAGLAFVAGSFDRVRDASRHEYLGLDAVLDAAPRGRRVCSMWYGDEGRLTGFPGYPHGYAGNLYVLRHGGSTAQSLMSNPSVPAVREGPAVAAPPWGVAWGFRPEQHMGWCELFLVRVDPGQPERPFGPKSLPKVELWAGSGRWRLWRAKVSAPLPPG